MSWMRGSLPQSDERAVVLRETSRGDELGDRDRTEAGQNLSLELSRMRTFPLPVSDGSLVRRILRAAYLRRVAAVGWVLSVLPELCEHSGGCLPCPACRLVKPLRAARWAVTMLPCR